MRKNNNGRRSVAIAITFLIGVCVSISIFLIVNNISIPGILGVDKSNIETAAKAMDTTEASKEAQRYVDVQWFDLSCVGFEEPAPIKDVYDNIARSNAILMRSNSTFKLRLGNRTTIPVTSCDIMLNDDGKSAALSADVKSRISPKDAFIAIIVVNIMNDPAGYTRTKGFSVPGSRITFIDKGELSIPTYTMMHEIGHALNLLHPFSSSGKGYGDLPPVCATSETRVGQLESCPERMRTCGGALDEDLTNVMDYLPERCGRKYYFSPYQMAVMERNTMNGGMIMTDIQDPIDNNKMKTMNVMTSKLFDMK